MITQTHRLATKSGLPEDYSTSTLSVIDMRRRSNAIISAVCVLFLLINLNLLISQNELASQRLNGFTDDEGVGNQTVPETPFIGIRSISPPYASTAGGDLINIATENISFTDKREIILFHDNNTTLENVVVNLSISDISDDGLRAHWNMDDEMNGTVQDFSGNEHHASLNGGSTINIGNGSTSSPDGALSIGRSGYLDIPDQPFENLSSGTISSWVNLSSNNTGIIMAKQHDGINSLAIFSIGCTADESATIITGQQGYIYFHSENQHQNLVSNRSIGTGTWHHLAVTFSPNGGTLWIDGIPSGSTTAAQNIPSITGGATTIGYWNRLGSPTLNGMVDDFSVWNRELNANEIESIAQANPLRDANNLQFQKDDGELVHHYSENEGLMVLLPELVPGNNTIVAAFIVGDNIEDISDGPFAEVSVTIDERIPDVEIWFGNISAREIEYSEEGTLQTISPPMPYGNHSVAVVLPNGTIHWVIDELRHINYHTYTGADVNWTVPDGVDEVTFKLWGAGGGSGDAGVHEGGPEGDTYYQSGGAGGYVQGTLSVISGQNLTLMVGKAGARTAQYQEYSGGGFAGEGVYYDSGAIRSSGGGGGLTAVFINNTTQEDALLIGGGGGGGAWISQQYLDEGIRTNGGIGAWPAGTNGSGGPMAVGAASGNQTAGGIGTSSTRSTGGGGSALLGGVSYVSGNNWYGGGAGGAGYFGGGGSGNFGPASQPGYSAGGGGGSSYYNSTFITGFNHFNGSNQSAPNIFDSDYIKGIAIGAEGGHIPDSQGGNGLIVIITENETSILYDGLGEEAPNDEGENEAEEEESIEAEEAPKFFEEPLEAITHFITENPAEAVVVTGSTGGLGIYLIGFRRQRNELKEALSAAGAWRTTGGAHLKSSFKALGILRKARAAAFTLGPLSWAWDEMLFASMSKKLAEYGISDVMTLEGLISWLVFDVLGLTFTSPVAFKEEFFPIVRMISTVLFIFFIYWVFLKRDSLLNKAKDMGDAEVEERKERIEQPRKGYV